MTPAGAVVPEKSYIDRKSTINRKNFEFNITAESQYFIGTWMEGLKGQNFSLELDGKKVVDLNLVLLKDGWQSVLPTTAEGVPGQVLLTTGKHTISVTMNGEVVPNVEALLVSEVESVVRYNETSYSNFVGSLKSHAQPFDKVKTPLGKSAATPEQLLIYYTYAPNTAFSYTYWKLLWLFAGSTVTYQTNSPSANCDPVLYLVSRDNPMTQSWHDDDGGGYPNSKLMVTVPQTGNYWLMVRAYASPSTGTVNITENGNPLVNGAAVAGTLISMGTAQSGIMNYFSTSTTDTRIWMLNGYNGNIVAENDDYAGTGNYSWGTNSRVKGDISTTPVMLLSAYSSYNPTGIADAYGPLKVGTVSFPNLAADDNIESSYGTETYNCITWAGGSTSSWSWPPYPGNPWYVANNSLQSFHNYFSNTCATGGTCKRYNGANIYQYDYSGSSSSGAMIALWFNQNDGIYTHASVTKPANGIPHGYDWESKPGNWARTFHPKTALTDNNSGRYGSIVGYYHQIGITPKVSAMSTPAVAMDISEVSSIAAGTSVMETPESFNPNEKNKITSLKNKIPVATTSKFVSLLAAWKMDIADAKYSNQSNPEMYMRLDSYKKWEDYCVSNGKVIWPLLVEELISRHPIIDAAIVQMLLPSNEKLLNDEVQSWVKNQYSVDGKFIIFNPENTRIRFAKKILMNEL